MGTLTGRPRFQPTEEQRVAMRLVESLVNDGHLVLEPDRWVPGGLRFQRPRQAPPAPPPMRTPNAAHVASLASVLIVLVFIAGVVVGAKMAGGW